jgi:hypothetical protein
LLSHRCYGHQHESHRGKYRCPHRFFSLGAKPERENSLQRALEQGLW